MQLDPVAYALRWSSRHFVSLHCVEELQSSSSPQPTAHHDHGRASRASRASQRLSRGGSSGSIARGLSRLQSIRSAFDLTEASFHSGAINAEKTLTIAYRDTRNARRTLTLRFAARSTHTKWHAALRYAADVPVRRRASMPSSLTLQSHLPPINTFACLSATPRLAAQTPLPVAHWAWVLSCIESTSSHTRFSGTVNPELIRTLLRRAHAPSGSEAVTAAVVAAEAAAARMPSWRVEPTALNPEQIALALLAPLTSGAAQPEVVVLFRRLVAAETAGSGGGGGGDGGGGGGGGGGVGVLSDDGWRAFCRDEQGDVGAGDDGGGTTTTSDDDDEDADHQRTRRPSLEALRVPSSADANDGLAVARRSHSDVDLLQFALRLLSPANDAVGPPPPELVSMDGAPCPITTNPTSAHIRHHSVLDAPRTPLLSAHVKLPHSPPLCACVPRAAPLSHYYHACSHNSYILGDQLTGFSKAASYRRQLVQGCRHLEIDCWDGRGGAPVVTHGRTFVTTEDFGAVAQAIADCAFVVSDMPVRRRRRP